MLHIRFYAVASLLLTAIVAVATSARPVAAQSAAPAGPRRVVVNGMDLTGVGYDIGSPTAPVVVVNFSDFGCPYCASFSRETYPTLAREFVATGKVFYKYVPFAVGSFLNGKQAARAAECAAEQGKFWAMHERLYVRQNEWTKTFKAFPVFASEAGNIGLDAARFSQCYETRRTDRRTEGASIIAKRLGLTMTPSFFVDGRLVQGALPLSQFQALLRARIEGVAP